MYIQNKKEGSQGTAEDWNQKVQECTNIITRANLTPSSADMQQLSKSTFIHAQFINIYFDNSTVANTYILIQKHSFFSPQLKNSDKIRFRARYSNTGASTLTVLGTTKPIKNVDGSELKIGDIIEGYIIEVRYCEYNGCDGFVLQKRKEQEDVGHTIGMCKLTLRKERQEGWVFCGEWIGDSQSRASSSDDKNYNLFRMIWTQYPNEPLQDQNGNTTNRTTADNDWNMHKRIRTCDTNTRIMGIADTKASGTGAVNTTEGEWSSQLSGENMPTHRHNNNIVRMMWNLKNKVVLHLGDWIVYGTQGKTRSKDLLDAITRRETFTAGLSGRGDRPYFIDTTQSSMKMLILIKQ